MGVGVEDGVEAGDVLADGLGVEVRAGVDEDGVWGPESVPFDADGGAGAAVLRAGEAGVGADGAGAAEGGDSHAGAATQECEGCLHKADLGFL